MADTQPETTQPASLIEYLIKNPDQLTGEIWSGIAMARDFGEPVSPYLPKDQDELHRQLAVQVQLGRIECRNGRWRVLDIPKPPPASQSKLF
jgi:hypothetical protein